MGECSVMDALYVNSSTLLPITCRQVAGHLLCDLPHVEQTDETAAACFLIDTAGCAMYETEGADDESKVGAGFH
jgi:hypothetical protein